MGLKQTTLFACVYGVTLSYLMATAPFDRNGISVAFIKPLKLRIELGRVGTRL